MSRRDTIIIAILLNAGLLIVLFVTSLKPNQVDPQPTPTTVLTYSQPDEKGVASLKQPAATYIAPSSDPVDQVIQQYVTPQVSTLTDPNPNFLADLQAIGSATAASPLPSQTIDTSSPSTDVATVDISFKELSVKKGDTLEKIAKQHHATVHEIMKANQLNSTRLKIGQVLRIPTKKSLSPVSNTRVTDTQYYIVKAGDNPWTIAVKHQMKVEELLKLNHLDEQKAKKLKVGDQLRVK